MAATQRTVHDQRGASTGPTRPPFRSDPTIAQAPISVWYRWLWQLVGAARTRLAGVSVLLLATLTANAGGIAVFGVLVEQVTEGDTAAIDNGVLHFLRQYQNPWLDVTMEGISMLGSELLVVIMVVVIARLAWVGRWGSVLSTVLVVGGAVLLNSVLKEYFQRARPAPLIPLLGGVAVGQEWSFPSGHAMVSAAFYLFLAYLTWRLLSGWKHVFWTSAIVTLVLLIGLSRLYLGVHYLTDVVAGYAAGGVWTQSIILSGKYLSYRRWTRGERRKAAKVEVPATPTMPAMPAMAKKSQPSEGISAPRDRQAA